MGPRRCTLTLGAAAGGLLAAAFLPMAVGSADDASDASVFDPLFRDFFGFAHDASEPTTVTWVSGEPPLYQSIHQSEFFDTTATDTLPAGSFQANDEVITSVAGPASLEMLVTSSEPGTSAPPVGSIYDVINIGLGFENVYVDIAPTTPGGADTLSDTLVTPFGDIPLMTHLHAFLDPADAFYLFDPADPLTPGTLPSTGTSADATTAASAFFDPIFGKFFGFESDTSEPNTVYGIAAIPPFYQSVHQTVSFDTAATDTLPAGSFEADNNVLTYGSGPGFSEILVTSSEPGTSAPSVGSVYEINHGPFGFENVYSDIAPMTPGGPDTLTDTLVTPFGNIPIMTNIHTYFDPSNLFFRYDSTNPLTDPADPSAAPFAGDPTGFDPAEPFAFFGFSSDASEPTTVITVSGLTGVVGFLPSFNSVHVSQSFDTTATDELPAGVFEANSNVITKTSGFSNAEILVTGSEPGTSAPPVGSVYDVINIGHGFENFYSDIAPTTPDGADTISDTLVTPFGDVPLMTDFHAFLDPTDLFFPY